MKIFFLIILFVVSLTGCSNLKESEKGEIQAVKMIKDILLSSKKTSVLLDTRKVITRKKIDDAKIPVLFVELENGQNGTLTLYPGKGIGETWLGADGTTITLKYGILKATRGMRRDVMGSKSLMPPWSEIIDTSEYSRQISYLDGDNQKYSKGFACVIKKHFKQTSIIVFDLTFDVQKYVETCIGNMEILENTYFVDSKNVVRRSKQYHGPALGYLLIERLER